MTQDTDEAPLNGVLLQISEADMPKVMEAIGQAEAEVLPYTAGTPPTTQPSGSWTGTKCSTSFSVNDVKCADSDTDVV